MIKHFQVGITDLLSVVSNIEDINMKNTENTRVTIKIFSIVPFPPLFLLFFISEKKLHQNSVQNIAPQEILPPVRIRVWFRVRIRSRVGEQFFSGAMALELMEIQIFLVLAETTYV